MEILLLRILQNPASQTDQGRFFMASLVLQLLTFLLENLSVNTIVKGRGGGKWEKYFWYFFGPS